VVVTSLGVPSNSKQFSVTLGIGKLSPASGVAGTTNVTILGSGFGQNQGSSAVTFNGVTAPAPGNWSDSSITVQVPSAATTGPVVVNVNAVNSNGVYFTVQPPPGAVNSITISPATATIVVGQTKNVTLKDNNGASITTAQWSVNNNTVSLSTDNPPVLTALAAGTVTLSATYSGFTAHATITVASGPLAIGTVLWSVPAVSANGNSQLLHVDNADDGGPALYALDTRSSTLSAFTDDGQLVWTVTDPPISGMAVDNNGGVLDFINNSSIVRRDSNTGLLTWRYDSPGTLFGSIVDDLGYIPGGRGVPTVAIHPDGTIYTAELLNNVISSPEPNYRAFQQDQIVALNPNIGQPKFTIPMPVNHVVVNFPGCPPSNSSTSDYHTPAAYGQITIGVYGTIYVVLQNSNIVSDFPAGGCSYQHEVRDDTVQLLTIQPDGVSNLRPLATYHYDFKTLDGNPPDIVLGAVIPDNNGGILANWSMSGETVGAIQSPQANIWHQDSTGVVNTYSLGTNEELVSSVMGQGNLVYSNGLQVNPNSPAIPTVTAYDASTGAVQWTTPVPSANSLQLNMAASDGVFITASESSGTSLVKLDTSGNQTPYNLGSNPTYATEGAWVIIDANGNLQLVVGPVSVPADSLWLFQLGNMPQQAAPTPLKVHFGPGPKTPGDNLTFPFCSQSLGRFECSAGWFWNVEVQAKVPDDASKWTISQSLSGRKKGFSWDSSGVLRSFGGPISMPIDTPDPPFIQQPSGQKIIFWIDGPGHFRRDDNGQLIDSVTQVENFTSTICSTVTAGTCFSRKWHFKLVVNPGAQLDTTNSKAGYGSLSTHF